MYVTIVLRPIKFRDTQAYFDLTHSDLDIKKYVPKKVKNTLAQTGEFLGECEKADFQTEYAYIIELHSSDGIFPIGALFASATPIYNSLTVTYFIGKHYRHQGYMKEALRKFAAFIKHDTRYCSLFFDIPASNQTCKNLVQSVGAKSAGISPISVFEQFERFELRLRTPQQ